MLLYQILIFGFLLLVFSCNALRCTTNCSFTYNTTKPFAIPDTCNQVVSAGKCEARLGFMYDWGVYFFDLSANLQTTIFNSNNQRRARLQLHLPNTVYLSHFVDISCKDKDDCARDLAINVSVEMSQRQYDFPRIMSELSPLILGPSLSSSNLELNCYDSNQKVHRCGTLTNPGSCIVANDITKNKISSSCKIDSFQREISISMYQEKNYATFDVRCNQNLCNGHATLKAVKQILFRHNITQTPDGRLNGASFRVSILLMIIMLFGLLSNR
ncbi:unnamed protein product [Rotaria sp. Silwood1]|nr:unnamed protein product [Rotaria sp. Silwood1]CAF1616996.1 unnamed protein product [Rotaria sp. Silwood1]CAF3701133.1 unnamed protein product [Rotaria sp. Silwood1]CAF3741269.1 unnamed protein product [Rotaria sp. Silwood1]CAF3744049.1 unnamed protein product [Rotaria sp. Silwood1]